MLNSYDPSYIDRDCASEYKGDRVTLIANAFITKAALPLSSRINPIFVAVWLGPLVLEDDEKVDFLKSHTPIGCRDLETLRRCQEKKIESYFSGCPTILCSPREGEAEIPGSILLVDVNPAIFESGTRSFLKQTCLPSSVTWATNVVSFDLTEDQRLSECRYRHSLITMAELIITNRIHVAIPALGMGKAVIFVEEDIQIPGRLTALPPSMKRYTREECRNLSFNPDDHRLDVLDYKRNVITRLSERCGDLPELKGDTFSRLRKTRQT